MAQVIEVRSDRNTHIGSITFDESPQHLHAQRTADGFRLHIPITISLKRVPKGSSIPLLGNFRATIYAGEDQGPKTDIGEIRWEEWEQGGVYEHQEHSGSHNRPAQMIWAGSLAQLAVYEKIRDGRQPKFEIGFTGELCFLFPTEPFSQRSHQLIRSGSERISNSQGNVRVSYPKELWVAMLRSLGVAENVLIEVPLPNCPSLDWNEVWQGLIDARNAFEQGGSTGWKGCVTGVRLALEKWQKIEPEDKGPGWVSPSLAEREARTKEQRLDNVRWHLLQAAHMGPHTNADRWSRDDALIMLSTLSVLLAERKP